MSESTATQSAEVESVLRAWAQAQAPEKSFDADRVFFFVQPVQHREGVFFAPGELVLGHLAEGEVADAAEKRGFPRPLSIWSFELKREVVLPPGLLRLEKAPPTAAPKQAVAAAK